MKKNKLSIIGSAGVPARYGGFETLAEQLIIGLNDQMDILVFCSTHFYSKSERKHSNGQYKRQFIRLSPNGFSSILYDAISMLLAIRKTDSMLVLGSSCSILFPILRVFKPKMQIVFHPDGIEWHRQKWNWLAKTFLKTSVKIGCRYASNIIIDNKALLPFFDGYKNKISLISYGGDHIKPATQTQSHENYWLTIARAEPENKLELIANAISQITNENWILISNYSQTRFGRKLFKKYKSAPNIQFLDQNYNTQEISEYLSKCKGYIHGHSAGGTNPVLILAMQFTKPLLCHSNIFNRETSQNAAHYFSNEQELLDLIRLKKHSFSYAPSNYTSCGMFEYSWKKVCQDYFSIFSNPQK